MYKYQYIIFCSILLLYVVGNYRYFENTTASLRVSFVRNVILGGTEYTVIGHIFSY